jgi:hypothetical protein
MTPSNGRSTLAGVFCLEEGEVDFLARSRGGELSEGLGQILPGGFQADAGVGGDAAEEGLVVDDHALAAAAPGQDRAGFERLCSGSGTIRRRSKTIF